MRVVLALLDAPWVRGEGLSFSCSLQILFAPVRYWRGPVWININWLLMQGFARYGFVEQAAYLKRTIIDLVGSEGFYEYFDPTNRRGHGSVLFSWTAALLLYVLMADRGSME